MVAILQIKGVVMMKPRNITIRGIHQLREIIRNGRLKQNAGFPIPIE